jgi:cephalosporin hydroxylase
MKPLNWSSETEFSVNGCKFLCSLDDYTRKSDAERLIILKDRRSLGSYFEALKEQDVRTVLEFGILEGGSAILFSELLDLEKFVGIDIRSPAPHLESVLARHDPGKRIKLHFGVSQSDETKVREVIREEFGTRAIDMIIDDASHEYAHTKRAFEIAFPHLRPGGLYVIEDWGWPHWKGCNAFMGQPAMSMLIFELAMLCATHPLVITNVWVFSGFTFVRKSPEVGDLRDFSVDRMYNKRDLYLSFRDFETELAKRTQELETVYASRGWRALEVLRRLKRRIVGPRPTPKASPAAPGRVAETP